MLYPMMIVHAADAVGKFIVDELIGLWHYYDALPYWWWPQTYQKLSLIYIYIHIYIYI